MATTPSLRNRLNRRQCLQGLKTAFGDSQNKCIVGSVKTNVGHLDAGAAISGIGALNGWILIAGAILLLFFSNFSAIF